MEQEVAKISKGKGRKTLERMKNRNAVGPDNIPVEFNP